MRTSRVLLSLLVLAFTASFALVARPAHAATINVTDLGDTGTGCTLREAIASANLDNAGGNGCVNGSGSDTIVLTLNGTYTVTSEVSVTSNITIQQGVGIGATISGGGTNRIFRGGAGGALTIEELILTSGSVIGNGGCIQFDATSISLTINNSIVENCTATSSGGAIFIFSGSSLSITGSTFQNNQAAGSGGAIATTATATIQSSTFTSNQIVTTGATAQGGAIAFTTSTFSSSVTGTTFSSNTVSGGSTNNQGGAIHHIGSNTTGLSISGSVFLSNSASGTNARGGAIHSGATSPGLISITSSRFQGNTSSTGTGSAFHSSGTGSQSLTGSCITSNGVTAVTDGETTNVMTATGNWWGSAWGPRITGVTGSQVSNGDTIPSNGLTPVNVGWATPGDEVDVPPTGNWLTSAPTVAGATCQLCVAASSVGYARVCS